MRVPLRISSIDQEHLQELYDSLGVARDELPYTEQFEQLYQGFQDRTFKNADREQVYAALLKHVRSSSIATKALPPTTLDDGQLKQLKATLSRHASGGKVLPYSDEFSAAHTEFTRAIGQELDERAFWEASLHALGARRKPPVRKAKPAADEQPSAEAGVE